MSLPFLNILRGLYFSRYSSWRLLMAPRRRCRMYCTASSYFIPPSIRASATRTGARPRPATQWIATVAPGFSSNVALRKSSHDWTMSRGGAAPSSNFQSCFYKKKEKKKKKFKIFECIIIYRAHWLSLKHCKKILNNT